MKIIIDTDTRIVTVDELKVADLAELSDILSMDALQDYDLETGDQDEDDQYTYSYSGTL